MRTSHFWGRNAEIVIEVVAAHYVYLAKLLLTARDPKIPRVGPQMKSAMAEMKVITLELFRECLYVERTL